MPGSYVDVNYRVRPAKNIERKMLCEAFRRLRGFANVDSYRYIGFGSTYFSDFALFHKALGIHNNVSIERDVGNRKRFEFNKPYRCVDLEFGESGDVLARISWNSRSIVWLDYDEKLDQDKLADVSLVTMNIPTGSILVVTVNANPIGGPQEATAAASSDENAVANPEAKPDTAPEGPEPNLTDLKKRFDETRIPPGLLEKELEGWGTASVYHRIVNNEIVSKVAARSAGLPKGNKIKYDQLFHFNYRDGTRMLTVGGIFYDEGQSSALAGCEFGSLDFVRSGDDPYKINVPSLTLKEMRLLDELLPKEEGQAITTVHAIPEKAIAQYEAVYRYFPAFVDAELD